MKQPRRKAGAVKRGPEAISGTREVVAGGGRIQAGVDAAEQDLQAGRDDVPQAFAGSRGKLSFAWSGG
jgi:hypothetical protein